ncbi:MAG: protoporphyrinogen oxidase [Myxococcota bacterium]|nr:protoporphyrinogen oxidase [Myxococcota bacterium]
MSTRSDVDALVVGAGIAGLGAARELERRGAEVLLVEAEDAPGGVMRTDEVDGYRIERGPSSLLLRAPLLRGLERMGLADALVRAAPASRSRWLLRQGRLLEVPLGALGLMRTPLLSGAAKRRLLREPFVARGDGRDETVAEFVTRRLGAELVDALVGPFLTGVYAGDERQLGAEAVFPALVRAEREHGSLVAGLLASALRRRDRGRAGTFSWPGGLGELARALAAGLRSEPRYATRVRRIESIDAGFRVAIASRGGSEEWVVRRLVMATPAAVASDLLRGIAAEAAAWIDSIEYAPLATVGFGAGSDAFRRKSPGFGFLVPRGEGRGLLGCLFISELFSDRAPPERRLLHCMLGGVRTPEVVDLDDSEIAALASEELDGPLGLAAPLDALQVRRWPRAVAQPKPGHAAGLRDARARLVARGPIALAGGYTDGVSVADSFASGVAAAAQLAPAG